MYKLPILLVAIISSLLIFKDKAIAQEADVPKPNGNGDFNSIFLQGNRGYYAVKKWLVIQFVESEMNGGVVNCRYTPNGEIRSRIPRGAILTAVFNQTANGRVPNPHTSADDAIVLDNNGSPWLRVIGTREELAYPVRPLTFDDLGECYVRANLKYIAPINPDAINYYDQKISRSYCISKPLYCLSIISRWLSLR
ncbi:hypothetical protein APA_476 [Pseudanabaena sp. lw0831]|uniref:hypothetical protein n=1 Tax=Pseudanabaena sp. lw0831 TaxID=1357935 RepID=UPI0019163820|nr:hypothetical protein [Pseudanabaena sp. lw0831]GBO51512.1 hypothetical protein APA_476 [Pseudanabaena sp. lw0831]